MTDAPLSRHYDLPRPVDLPDSWHPSRRDRAEGIIAYALLGAVICAMLYVGCRVAMFFS